jgi:hypothetical protein
MMKTFFMVCYGDSDGGIVDLYRYETLDDATTRAQFLSCAAPHETFYVLETVKAVEAIKINNETAAD